jgi:glucosyl-3-phosphoglycerate synthase
VTVPDARTVPAASSLDLAEAARRKQALGITTSVVIPAHDEGPRVGAVVAAVRRAMEPAPGAPVGLVDEMVVVDGGSRDDTVAEAERAGARVVRQDAHDGPGKGAALRLGVAATSGELVAFVDGDVLDPDPSLAVGTLATLLLDDRLRLVKSAAQRSWEGGDGSGGGRVTELTVRPLLALLWPELAHVAQPLAGEYAADRGLLEALPFERGYGVELGILLDTLRCCGADAIGQVDLGVRGHAHQPLDALARMAAELLLVVADRLACEGRPLAGIARSSEVPLPRALRDEAGRLRTVTEQVRRVALPPLAPSVSGGPSPRRRGPSRSS